MFSCCLGWTQQPRMWKSCDHHVTATYLVICHVSATYQQYHTIGKWKSHAKSILELHCQLFTDLIHPYDCYISVCWDRCCQVPVVYVVIMKALIVCISICWVRFPISILLQWPFTTMCLSIKYPHILPKRHLRWRLWVIMPNITKCLHIIQYPIQHYMKT